MCIYDTLLIIILKVNYSMQQQLHNSNDQAPKQPQSEVCNIMEIHAINIFKGALNLK